MPLLIFCWVLGSCWYFCYYTQLHDTESFLKFDWWSYLPRFLLLAISITISTCSFLLLHFCATVYCTLIHQVCQTTSYISFQVLIQVTFILLLIVTLLHWRLPDMQYMVLPCAPMFIPMLIFSFQVKSFNDGILLVDPVMTSTCTMCTSGTRHMYLSCHRVHLLITLSCYTNTFFNICFCIILNTYFLTDCLTAIYYIMLYYFYFTLM